MRKVSVIIPSYNHERFVGECIESVLKQTFQDFEVIITDDGSRDRTVEGIGSFQDPRITLFVHDRNRGVSEAANNCIRHSSGQYIAWLSTDDAWLPRTLEMGVNYLDGHPDIGAVFGKVAWVSESGQPITDPRYRYLHAFDVENRSRFAWLRRFFYEGNCLNIPSSLVRRECFDEIGLFNPSMANLPDFDLWVRLCLKYDIHVLDEIFVRNRRVGEDSNASGDNASTRRRTRFEYKQLLDHYLELGTAQELLEVFPEAARYGRITDDTVPYFVARTAIDAEPEFMKMWGLEVLYSFLKDEEHARQVEEQSGFSHRDLIDLTGKVDAFNLSSFEELHSPGSRWTVISFIRRVLAAIVPPGSSRERTIDLAYKVLQRIRGEGISILARPVYYWQWTRRNEPLAETLARQKQVSDILEYRPLISVIMPVYNVELDLLKAAIASVRAQSYENWELCIADDASSQADIRPYLERISTEDARIRVTYRSENGHISQASNSAIELAAGEFICTLDNDDVLYPQALFKLVERLNVSRELDVIYTDSDIVDRNFRRSPAFKPDWSPDLFYSNNYLNHLTLLRKSLVDEVGGFRTGFEGSQDYDLYLRVLAKTSSSRVAHIPEVLYGWRSVPGSAAAGLSSKGYASEAGKRALSSILNAEKLKADVRPGILPNTFHVHYLIRKSPKLSVIIAGSAAEAAIRTCMASLRANADYPIHETIVLGQPFTSLPEEGAVRFIDCSAAPSQAQLLNIAVEQAAGQFVLLLDGRLTFRTPNSALVLLSDAQRTEIGIVGPKITFQGQRIYSAGVFFGSTERLFAHGLHGMPDVTYRYAGNTVNNCLALSDLCFMLAKAKYQAVQGYTEEFGTGLLAHLDFCLRLHELGYRHLYTPFVTVYNQASANEPVSGTGAEAERFRAKWSKYLQRDPYYSPNYSRKRAGFSL